MILSIHTEQTTDDYLQTCQLQQQQLEYVKRR